MVALDAAAPVAKSAAKVAWKSLKPGHRNKGKAACNTVSLPASSQFALTISCGALQGAIFLLNDISARGMIRFLIWENFFKKVLAR